MEIKDLLEQYYQHLQHTEKQRSTFLQIYLALTGAGVIGFESVNNLNNEIKLIVSILMIIVTWYGLEIMEKSNLVITAYSRSIIAILADENPQYCVNNELPTENDYSKSRAYKSIFKILMCFYSFLTGYYIGFVIC